MNLSLRQRSLLVFAAQLVLVLSVAAKYLYERHTCPRVWTRATQFDPSQPLRGRYLALTLHADSCGLPPGTASFVYRNGQRTNDVESWTWDVVPAARDGVLTAMPAPKAHPEEAMKLTHVKSSPCSYAQFGETTEFFIADNAHLPFPLAKGEELWAEVTVPPSGPPRAIRLATSDGKTFRILNLR